MDAAISTGDAVPERRTKSWRREHEETCTRRYLSSYSNVQKVTSPGNDDPVGRSRFSVESSNESTKDDNNKTGEKSVPCCDIDVSRVKSKINVKEGDVWEKDRSTSVDNKNQESVCNEVSESKESFVSNVSKRRATKYLGSNSGDNVLDVDRENVRKSGSHDTIESFTVERSSGSYVKSSKRSTFDRSYNDDNTNNIKTTNDKQYKHKNPEGSDSKITWEGKHSGSINYSDNSRVKHSAKYEATFDNSENSFSQRESKDICTIEQKNKDSTQYTKKSFHKVDDSHSDSGRNNSVLSETCENERVKVNINLQKKKMNETENKLSSQNRAKSDDSSASNSNDTKHFSQDNIPCNQERSNLHTTMMKDCVPENAPPSSQSDILEKTVIPGFLKEIKDSSHRETEVTSFETYLASCDGNAFTLCNDTIGLCVGADGKVQVVMPKQRMKLEDKLAESPDNSEFQEKDIEHGGLIGSSKMIKQQRLEIVWSKYVNEIGAFFFLWKM
ncbi:hypothetical protein R5R35_010240 [Gryllus longicercus]|uniref:Uncharacterized protein n=1 Tax=Gryllus longicercus TaxID=2509291 RepID=A0AAN9VA34_9ORTH